MTDARELLDRAESALADAHEFEKVGDGVQADRLRHEARTLAVMADADAQLRVASAIAHVTHRGAILTQQRGG